MKINPKIDTIVKRAHQYVLEGMSQEQACKKAGVSKSAYYRRLVMKKAKAAVGYEKIQQAASSGVIPVMLCTPDQIKELFQ